MKPNRSEQAFIDAMAPHQGILLTNIDIGGGANGKQGREVDAVLLTARELVVVEVKGTAATGRLEAPLNGSWTIGDDPKPFHGSVNPAKQASVAAKVLASVIQEAGVKEVFVQAAVAIDAPDHAAIDYPEVPLWVGTTAVVPIPRFDDLRASLRGALVTPGDVVKVMRACGFSAQEIPDTRTILDIWEAIEPLPEPTLTPPSPPEPRLYSSGGEHAKRLLRQAGVIGPLYDEDEIMRSEVPGHSVWIHPRTREPLDAPDAEVQAAVAQWMAQPVDKRRALADPSYYRIWADRLVSSLQVMPGRRPKGQCRWFDPWTERFYQADDTTFLLTQNASKRSMASNASAMAAYDKQYPNVARQRRRDLVAARAAMVDEARKAKREAKEQARKEKEVIRAARGSWFRRR